MAILDVCFIARAGITVPDDIANALRYDTGATKTVWEVYWQVFANPTEAVLSGAWHDSENHQAVFIRADNGAEIRRDLTAGHELTREADRVPVTNEGGDIINYRLRMKQPVERPVVAGGWKLIPGAQVGEVNLYHVQADGAALLRLHEWMTEDTDNPLMHSATGALCVQDTSEGVTDTMEPDGVYDRLNKNPTWWTARKAALASYYELQVEGSEAAILAANNEPTLLLALLKAAQPQLTNAELIDAFWRRW